MIITLVKEFESNDMREVIRRIFVRQTKINCMIVLASGQLSLRLERSLAINGGPSTGLL